MKEIENLLDGIGRFRKKYFESGCSLYADLFKQQSPKVLVIGCSDSRVDPAILTDCQPGDLFVLRTIANLVPHYEPSAHCAGVRAAIEYAVKVLQVKHIIVMGHSNCGGIAALMQGISPDSFEYIGEWMDIAAPAVKTIMSRKDIPAEQTRQACEQEAIALSLRNLLTFPWIRSGVESDRLVLHGWYFDITAGELSTYDLKQKTFKAVGR